MLNKTYKIGDVAALLNLKTYVLRFWETEFRQLRPHRTPKGQRIYTEKDVELLRRIQYLLHEKGMTIEGARRRLSEKKAPASQAPLDSERLETRFQNLPLSIVEPAADEAEPPAEEKEIPRDSLEDIVAGLREIRDLLRS